jgi:hypothetical protein
VGCLAPLLPQRDPCVLSWEEVRTSMSSTKCSAKLGPCCPGLRHGPCSWLLVLSMLVEHQVLVQVLPADGVQGQDHVKAPRSTNSA